jgi:hypothetical protein
VILHEAAWSVVELPDRKKKTHRSVRAGRGIYKKGRNVQGMDMEEEMAKD